jgi:hypothetical protein
MAGAEFTANVKITMGTGSSDDYNGDVSCDDYGSTPAPSLLGKLKKAPIVDAHRAAKLQKAKGNTTKYGASATLKLNKVRSSAEEYQVSVKLAWGDLYREAIEWYTGQGEAYRAMCENHGIPKPQRDAILQTLEHNCNNLNDVWAVFITTEDGIAGMSRITTEVASLKTQYSLTGQSNVSYSIQEWAAENDDMQALIQDPATRASFYYKRPIETIF